MGVITVQPQNAYLLSHSLPADESNDTSKILGIYSSLEAAQSAITRFSVKPGFRDFPEGFVIDAYLLDEDQWQEGFFVYSY